MQRNVSTRRGNDAERITRIHMTQRDLSNRYVRVWMHDNSRHIEKWDVVLYTKSVKGLWKKANSIIASLLRVFVSPCVTLFVNCWTVSLCCIIKVFTLYDLRTRSFSTRRNSRSLFGRIEGRCLQDRLGSRFFSTFCLVHKC